MGLFSKIFGTKAAVPEKPLDLVESVLKEIVKRARLSIEFEVSQAEGSDSIEVHFFGEDEDLLLDREGQLLDAFQLYLKRAIQHQMPESVCNVAVDCAGFRDQINESLIKLADKLKGIALAKGKPVYFRALPPRDRKVIHQYLAEDGAVKSRSVGDGLYKKIKIYPADNEEASAPR